MDTSTLSNPSSPLPRYFWRRLFAYGLDVALAWIIASLLLGVFVTDDFNENLFGPDQDRSFGFNLSVQAESFHPPLSFYSTTCGAVTGDAKASLANYVAPATIKTAQLCIVRD